MIDFGTYKFIPYEEIYKQELIDFLATCYSEFEPPMIVEFDSVDEDLPQIEEVYKAPSAFRLLLDPAKNNQLIGSIAVKIPEASSKEAYLKRVFLNRDYRGQGLGKKLSLWAFNYAKEKGCREAHIWSGIFCHDAHRLYKGLGAKDTKEIRCIGGSNNINEYHFIKEL